MLIIDKEKEKEENLSRSHVVIRVARDEVVHLKRKLSDIMFDELIEIRDELTVEQRSQINRKIRELASQQSNQ